MSDPKHLRALALCIFRHRDRILVLDLYDPSTGKRFHRPAGGGIEFGEPSEDALRREMREELGVEIEAPVLLGVLENIFFYNGQPGHEIVFVYDAQFVDQELYEVERFTVHEDTGETFHAVWLELSASGPQTPPVYPEGLIELLKEQSKK